MRDATELATEIVKGDWAERKTWVRRITDAILQARAEGAMEMREKFCDCFETWIDLNESTWVTLPKGLRAALLDSFIDVLKSTQGVVENVVTETKETDHAKGA